MDEVYLGDVSLSLSYQADSDNALRSPRPRLELARCPRMPSELRRVCASLNSLFFLIIGVSRSGTVTISSVINSTGSGAIDFLVFLTNTSGGPMRLRLAHEGCEIVRGGDGR